MRDDSATADAPQPDFDLFADEHFVDADDTPVRRTHIRAALAAVAVGVLCAALATAIVTRPFDALLDEFSATLDDSAVIAEQPAGDDEADEPAPVAEVDPGALEGPVIEPTAEGDEDSPFTYPAGSTD